jgi:hypothetical protein
MQVRNGRELTPRERDVLQGIWTGLSNKEIAASYGISHGTIPTASTEYDAKMARGQHRGTVGTRRGPWCAEAPCGQCLDRIQTPREGTNIGGGRQSMQQRKEKINAGFEFVEARGVIGCAFYSHFQVLMHSQP